MTPDVDHALRNQISIVLGYCELLLGELPDDSPLRGDIVEMRKAALAAMELMRGEGGEA